MKKLLKYLSIIIILIVAVVLIAGLFISKEFKFEKSIVINASQEEVWKNVSQFNNFQKWNPLKAYDTNMKYEIKGEDGSIGSEYLWSGNAKVGRGKQILKAILPMSDIAIDMNYIEPMESHSHMYYHLQPISATVTKITWGLEAKIQYPMNAIMVFIDVAGYMSKDFELGLGNLKKLCENNTRLTASLQKN